MLDVPAATATRLPGCPPPTILPLKGILPGCVVLSQHTAENFFRDRGIIRECERDVVVELPIVGPMRAEGQQYAALRDVCFRGVALDLQGDGVGGMLVPSAFIAFGFGNFLPLPALDVNIQFAITVLIICGRVEL